MRYEKITESEWQIMRILWENNPQSSAQIINHVALINVWCPTTIKTFISRLVDKKILGFKTANNKRLYSPLITEKDCVINEMKSVIQMIYGGKINSQTDNFVFYGHDDQEFINQLSSTIEIDYKSLSQHFNYHLTEKQSIYLYSNQNRLFSAFGMNSAPSWVRAGSMWEILHLAPKETFDDRNPNRLLHHILTESILYHINSTIPYWLQQGVAAYESKWLSCDDIKRSILKQKAMINNLDLSDLSEHFQLFRESNGHELTFSLIEYIVITYGYSLLNDFVRNPNETKRIFKLNSQTLLENWKTFISNQYLKG